MPTTTFPGFTLDVAPENFDAAYQAALADQLAMAQEEDEAAMDPANPLAPGEGAAALGLDSTAAISAILDASRQLSVLQQEDATRAVAAGQIAAQLTMEEGIQALKRQQQTTAMATALGVNQEDKSTDMSLLLAEEMRKHLTGALEKAKAVQALEDKRNAPAGIFKDPLGTLKAEIMLPSAIIEYNQEQELFNITQQGLAALNAAAQSSAKTQADITPQVTTSIVAAKAAEIKLNADTLANKAKQDAITTGINAKKTELEAIQWYDSLEERQAARATRKDAAGDEALKRATLVEAVKQGYGVMYPDRMIPYTDEQIWTRTSDPNIQAFAAIGSNSQANGRPIIARSPGQSYEIMRVYQAELPQAMRGVARLINEAAEKEKAETGAASEAGINQRFGLLAKAQSSKIVYADNANIYQAPDAQAVMVSAAALPDPTVTAAHASLARTKFFQEILLPQVQSGMTESNPTKIVELAVASVTSGKVPLQDAIKGVSGYFKTAVAVNNVKTNYIGLGVDNQKNYNASVSPKGTLFSDVVDLTDETRVAAYLTKLITRGSGTSTGGVYIGETIPVPAQGD